MFVVNNMSVTLTDLEGKVDKTKYMDKCVMNFKCSNHHVTRISKLFESSSQLKYMGTSATS
jgi:hypothetical protein